MPSMLNGDVFFVAQGVRSHRGCQYDGHAYGCDYVIYSVAFHGPYHLTPATLVHLLCPLQEDDLLPS